MDDPENIVYSPKVLEFVAVANEYCIFFENVEDFSLKDFIDKAHKILPLLYQKAVMLPHIESAFEDANEKFVDEYEYNQIFDILRKKLGQYDAYQEVFDPIMQESEEPVSASLAEDFSDIFQDLKDFLLLYRISTNEVMNDALWECQQNFEDYWGQKLTNAMRALHNLRYGNHNLEEPAAEHENNDNDTDFNDIDTSSWFISRRQEDFRNGE